MEISLDYFEVKCAIQRYLQSKGIQVSDVEKDITIPSPFVINFRAICKNIDNVK